MTHGKTMIYIDDLNDLEETRQSYPDEVICVRNSESSIWPVYLPGSNRPRMMHSETPKPRYSNK